MNNKPMLIDLIADWDYNEQQFDVMLPVIPPIYKPAFKHKIALPKHLPNIRYDQFFDLHTLFKLKGIDTDINREEFVKEELIKISVNGKDFNTPPFNELIGGKHNALWDAYINKLCYDKLISL